MNEADIKLLTYTIENAMQWITKASAEKQEITQEQCQLRINEINYICNQIYQNMNLLKIPEPFVQIVPIVDDADSDSPIAPALESTSTVIDEKINDLINFLDVESEDTEHQIDECKLNANDIYLKIDLNKLATFCPGNSNHTLKMLKN